MTLHTSFPSTVFSSQIPDIELTTTVTRVLAVITYAGKELLNETLFPNSDGEISIADLSELVRPYARDTLVGTFLVTLTDQTVTTDSDNNETVTDGTPVTLSTKVVYCSVMVSEDAETFCSGHFLSRLQGAKLTALGRLEYLHYIGTDTPSATALYADGTTATFTPTNVGGNTNYTTIDVSPSLFTTEGKTLVQYTVTAGDRSQQFDIDPAAPDCAPVLLFTNSWGCQELVYCTGTHTVAPEFTFTAGYMRALYRNYSIDETRLFKADTGVLTFPMADWLSDLFRSDEIYLVTFAEGEPTVGNRVTLTEQKSEYSNDYDSLPRFTFSYRYAQRNQNVMEIARAGRIFDNTFDFTFN